MNEQCPKCLSERIGKNNYGKKAAGVVGAAAGVYGGYASAIAGARTGAMVGAVAGPVSGIGGAVIGGLLAYMPLELKLRGKSTTQSHRTPIFYVDLVIKEGVSLQEAVAEAKETAKKVAEEGIDQAALDAAAAKGFGNTLFEYDEDEMSQVIEEFYPSSAPEDAVSSSIVSGLRENLKAARSIAG